MSKQPWLRLYRDSLHNPKVVTLSDRQYRAWVNCMLMSDNDGYLPSLRDVAVHMRVTRPDAEQLVCELVEAELIDPEMLDGQRRYRLHDWEQHQAPSDNAAERMKKLREKRRSEHVRNSSEPVPNSYGTESESESEEDTEIQPVRMEQEAVRASAREQVGNLSFSKIYDEGPIERTLTARAEGLGLDVADFVAKTKQYAKKNHSGYFKRLCVNALQPHLPKIPEKMLFDALAGKSEAYTLVVASLMEGARQ